jgi:hypothetical protein
MKTLAMFAIVGALGCEAGVTTHPVYAPVAGVPTNWVTLADHNVANSPKQQIATRGESFRQIRIEAESGAPVIKQVAIEFSDEPGNTQVVKLQQRLPAGQGQTIDLNGAGRRQVKRIIVYTEPSYGGSYSLLGA